MIANAGALGLDWRTLDLSDYLEALEAHNESHDPNAGNDRAESDPDWLAKMMATRVAGESRGGKG